MSRSVYLCDWLDKNGQEDVKMRIGEFMKMFAPMDQQHGLSILEERGFKYRLRTAHGFYKFEIDVT